MCARVVFACGKDNTGAVVEVQLRTRAFCIKKGRCGKPFKVKGQAYAVSPAQAWMSCSSIDEAWAKTVEKIGGWD